MIDDGGQLFRGNVTGIILLSITYLPSAVIVRRALTLLTCTSWRIICEHFNHVHNAYIHYVELSIVFSAGRCWLEEGRGSTRGRVQT